MSAALPLQLAPMNARLAAFGELPAQAVHEWLWGTDPEEPYHVDVLLNRNQLLGLMVCRHKFLRGRVLCSESTYFAAQHRLTIMDKPVEQMTWRELKDTVANILIEWPSFLERLRLNIRAKQNLRQVLHLINMCAMRFGELAYTAAGQDVLDDLPETQPHKSGDGTLTLTAGGLRRMVGSLLIMYRHLYLLSMCSKVPPQAFDPQLTKYHYEASNDAFNLLCMHMTLPVAARLNYRHDFPGMYNHVSQVWHKIFTHALSNENNTLLTPPVCLQVVYFHNNQYSRIPRHPLEDARKAPAIHLLPAIQELYPEIQLRFEEDNFDPTKAQGWYWLLLAGRIYLVTPEPRVLYSDNVFDLLKVFVDANPRVQEEKQEDPDDS